MLSDVSNVFMYNDFSYYDEKCGLSTPCSSTKTSTEATPVDIELSWWQSYTTSMIKCTKESAKYLDLLHQKGRYLQSSLSKSQEINDQESLIRSLKIQQGLIKAHFYRISCVIQEIFPGDCPSWDNIVEITGNKPITSCKCQEYLRRISALENVLFEAETDLKFHNSEIVTCISTLLTHIDLVGINSVVAELDLKAESELSLRDKCSALEEKLEVLKAQNCEQRTIFQHFESEKARLENFVSLLQQSEFELKSNLDEISDDYLQLHNDYQQLSEFHRSSQDAEVNLELQLAELQNEYDGIKEELDNRTAESRGYAEQLDCKDAEFKSLETQLCNCRSELVSKSATVVTQLRELDLIKAELSQQKKIVVDQRLELLILETESTKRAAVDAEKIIELMKEVTSLKAALSVSKEETFINFHPAEGKDSPAQCLTLSDNKAQLSVSDIHRSVEEAAYGYEQHNKLLHGSDKIVRFSSAPVGSELAASATTIDHQETRAIMPRRPLEFDASQGDPSSVSALLLEAEHAQMEGETSSGNRRGTEPSSVASHPRTIAMSSYSEQENSIIDDLQKLLRALVVSPHGSDASVNAETTTHEGGRDRMAVIGALVSSLVSRTDDFKSALSSLARSDAAAAAIVVPTDSELGSIRNSNLNPIPHSVDPTVTVETDLTYDELLSELIQAKVKLASTADELLKARGKRKKIPVS